MKNQNKQEFLSVFSDEESVKLINSIYNCAENTGLLRLLDGVSSYKDLRNMKNNPNLASNLNATLEKLGDKEGTSAFVDSWALAQLAMLVYAERHGVAELKRADKALAAEKKGNERS